MFRILSSITILFILAGLAACTSDDKARDEATTAINEEIAALNAPLSPSIGKVAITSNEKLVLDNNKEIELPEIGDTSVVTLFIIRGAESMEGKTSLSEPGLNRSGYLASLMGRVNLAQVYSEGNSALQTGMFSAQANQAEVNLFKGEQAKDFVSMVVGNFKGKRVLIIGMPKTVPALLNVLAGKIVEGKMPEEEYEHFYIVKVKKIGDVEIVHASY